MGEELDQTNRHRTTAGRSGTKQHKRETAVEEDMSNVLWWEGHDSIHQTSVGRPRIVAQG
jgi:hypothetical protein